MPWATQRADFGAEHAGTDRGFIEHHGAVLDHAASALSREYVDVVQCRVVCESRSLAIMFVVSALYHERIICVRRCFGTQVWRGVPGLGSADAGGLAELRSGSHRVCPLASYVAARISRLFALLTT